MKLTKEEQEICKKYSARDKDGYVHCAECPLSIKGLYMYGLCKKTMSKKEWEDEHLKEITEETDD